MGHSMPERNKNDNLALSIYEDLLKRTLSDDLKPGTRLPSERELAAHYQTNRNTLREALRKLEHAHLVSVRHGQGVTILDCRKTATVECLGPFLMHASSPSEQSRTLLDLLMARVHLLEMSVALAAQRAKPEDIEQLERLVELQLHNFETDDREALIHDDVELINALVDAAHSLTARWIANTLLEVYRGLISRTQSLWVSDPSFPDYLRCLLRCISENDPEGAVSATRTYYAKIDRVLLTLLSPLLEAGRKSNPGHSEPV